MQQEGAIPDTIPRPTGADAMRLILEVDNEGHLLVTGPLDDTQLCLTMLDNACVMILEQARPISPIEQTSPKFCPNPVKSYGL